MEGTGKCFVVNSFNRRKYAQAAVELVRDLLRTLPGCRVVVAFGSAAGAGWQGEVECRRVADRAWCLLIRENLSDNNAFAGVSRAFKAGHLREEGFESATYVYLHDTCRLGRTFPARVAELPRVEGGWVFAHMYGLYNMGICDLGFLVRRGGDFDGVKLLPKQDSIHLEQGFAVSVDGVDVKPLSHYSQGTLTGMVVPGMDFERCDHVTLNACGRDPSERRFVNFIGSLGVFKLVGSNVSFFVPIWASPSHHVETLQDRSNMLQAFGRVSIVNEANETHGYLSPWIPLVPLHAGGGGASV